MPIILFEGVDEIGKSTLIKQLHEKYPDTKTFAYPSAFIRELKLENPDNLDELFAYHERFLYDFTVFNDMLKEWSETKTVLLDRYFYSNAAYFIGDLVKYYCSKCDKIDTLKDYKQVNKLIKKLAEKTLFPFYRELVQPTWTFYLVRDVESVTHIDDYYRTSFARYGNPNFSVVLGLRDETMDTVECCLMNQGLLPFPLKSKVY